MRAISGRLILLTLGLAAGCGSALEPADDYDSDEACEVLVTALEAWKLGEPGRLAQREPAIRFDDDDLIEGAALMDFSLENAEADLKPFADVPVELVLRNKRGETTRIEISGPGARRSAAGSFGRRPVW